MVLIFSLTFIAVFLTVAAVLTIPFSSRARVKQSLGRLGAYKLQDETPEEDDADFMERVVWPVADFIGALARKWTSEGQMSATRNRLVLAGVRNLTAEKFRAIQLAIAALGLIVYLMVIFPWLVISGRPLWLGLPVVAVAFFLPGAWLQRRIEARQAKIGSTLADAIDVLKIGIEAGLAFDSALTKVAKNMEGPLGEEFGRTLGELQIGVSRREALRNLGERTTVPELQSFCTTLIQADTLGISIGKILKTEAVELRTRRRQAAEEKALKIPVKLVFPIILCILPALMIIIIGPGIIRIAEAFMSMR